MQIEEWKQEYKEFETVTRQFYTGEVSTKDYKGFSGGFGSYAQRGGTASMLRLRFPGGRISQDKLAFVVNSIKKYNIDKVHFTTCQTIQLHNLNADAVCDLASAALDYGIITRGGGGDFPRNVMVSPLSGVEQGEYFDVSPYARAASDYLMTLIHTVKLPRKLKVGFSNSPANVTHATFRDLGFVARKDGAFDVYSAGGLGANPKMGILVAEAIDGSQILYYIKAMVKLFTTYGNYQNRAKARTRYMQDTLGADFAKAFQDKLAEALNEEDLTISITPDEISKTPDDIKPTDSRAIPQKQPGLYAVKYHPIGGCPAPEKLIELYDTMCKMPLTELRLAPDETLYIVNCTGSEAETLLALTNDGASSEFEASVACIGASICQIGVRDSQKLLRTLTEASRTWNFKNGTLPKIHISGCPSSCGTHQIGEIGFRGGAKKVNGKTESAFVLFVNGNDTEGQERFGEQLGTITEQDIPQFLHDLGTEIEKAGLSYSEWYQAQPTRIQEIAAPYINK
ncbi:MAG: nitrite/sulfite reductase [Eubacteriales bacterium]|nr:nitrite/sulfite reductase [Eubacteriales bacterium]